jgi:hypothetical protein
MFFNSASSFGKKAVNPLAIGAGYAPVRFRHSTLGDPSLNFATVANGADTEVTQWLDQSGNAHHATAPTPTAGGTDNMLYVPNAINGNPAIKARSMSTGSGTFLAPVRKGVLAKTTGNPTTTGWTKHLLFAFNTFAYNAQSNSLMSNRTGTAGHLLRQLTSTGLALQCAVASSGANSLNILYDYILTGNWFIFTQTCDPITYESKVYFNGNFVAKGTLTAASVADPSFAYGAYASSLGSPADAFFGMGQVHEGVLTEADIALFCAYEFAKWGWTGLKKPIYFDWLGNSIFQGDYAGNGVTTKIQYKTMQILLGKTDANGQRAYPSVNGWNYGRDAARTSQLLTEANSTSNTTDLMYVHGGAFAKFRNPACRRICVIWEGTNTIAAVGGTVSGAYSDLLALVAAAKATGKYTDILVLTCLPRFQNTTLTLLTTELFQYNELIRDGMELGGDLRAAGATHLADVQTLAPYQSDKAPITTGTPGTPPYGDAGQSPFNATWYAPNPTPVNGFATDSIHPTEAGHQLIAELIVNSLGL